MGKLAGNYIDLNKMYGSDFSGDFNAHMTNTKTLKTGALHHLTIWRRLFRTLIQIS
jgi:hypothetical protein